MDFYKSFRGMILVKLRITGNFACIDKSTSEIKKQGSFAECDEYFNTFVRENGKA
jgi:hypothetical protein